MGLTQELVRALRAGLSLVSVLLSVPIQISSEVPMRMPRGGASTSGPLPNDTELGRPLEPLPHASRLFAPLRRYPAPRGHLMSRSGGNQLV